MEEISAIKRLAGKEDFLLDSENYKKFRAGNNYVPIASQPINGSCIPLGAIAREKIGAETVDDGLLTLLKSIHGIRIRGNFTLPDSTCVDVYTQEDIDRFHDLCNGDLCGGTVQLDFYNSQPKATYTVENFRNGVLMLYLGREGAERHPSEGENCVLHLRDCLCKVYLDGCCQGDAPSVCHFKQWEKYGIVAERCPNVFIYFINFKSDGADGKAAVLSLASDISFFLCSFDGDRKICTSDGSYTDGSCCQIEDVQKNCTKAIEKAVKDLKPLEIKRTPQYVTSCGKDSITGVSWILYNNGRLIQWASGIVPSFSRVEHSSAFGNDLLYVFKCKLPKAFKDGYEISLSCTSPMPPNATYTDGNKSESFMTYDTTAKEWNTTNPNKMFSGFGAVLPGIRVLKRYTQRNCFYPSILCNGGSFGFLEEKKDVLYHRPYFEFTELREGTKYCKNFTIDFICEGFIDDSQKS